MRKKVFDVGMTICGHNVFLLAQTNINEGAAKVDRKSSCIIFHLFLDINYLSEDYYRWISS